MAPDVCCDGIHFDLSDDHRKVVFSKIEDLRLSKVLCDVQLNVGNKQFFAHKLLLASSVPYFYSMFTHDLIESRQDVITLKDMDPVSIEAIIDFVYTSKITINQKNVQALLHVATLLQVNLVQKKCSDFLEQQLDPTNCLGIYAFAEMHGCVHLKTKAKNYCDRNFSKVVNEEEYLSLPFERLRWFLDQNELCVRSEIEVFDAVFQWVYYDIAHRKDRLLAMLSLVRLHLLPKKFLASQLESNEFISSDPEQVAFLHNILRDIELRHIPVSERVPLGSTVIFVMGGYNKKSFATYECFNPETEEWQILGEMPKPKSGAGAVFLGGMLYLIGGRTNFAIDKIDSDSLECYDPYTQDWTTLAPLNTPRHRLGLGTIDGVIYALGGSDSMIHLNSMEKYDIDKDVWTPVASMNTPRMGVGVAVLDGSLYAVGGFDSENRLRTVECYCPEKNKWKYVAAMNTPRSGAGVSALNGHVYAVGGYNGVAQLNSVERYCPNEDKWTMITPMNEHRSALSVAVVHNKLFALGGYNGDRFLDSMEVYDPESGEWQIIKPMPDARSGAGVAVGTIPIT